MKKYNWFIKTFFFIPFILLAFVLSITSCGSNKGKVYFTYINTYDSNKVKMNDINNFQVVDKTNNISFNTTNNQRYLLFKLNSPKKIEITWNNTLDMSIFESDTPDVSVLLQLINFKLTLKGEQFGLIWKDAPFIKDISKNSKADLTNLNITSLSSQAMFNSGNHTSLNLQPCDENINNLFENDTLATKLADPAYRSHTIEYEYLYLDLVDVNNGTDDIVVYDDVCYSFSSYVDGAIEPFKNLSLLLADPSADPSVTTGTMTSKYSTTKYLIKG